MLHLNHLKKSFGRNEILTDVEYTFEEGNIYPVLGGAGAGRTTLFECIAGDISVDSGTVETRRSARFSLLQSRVFCLCLLQDISLSVCSVI